MLTTTDSNETPIGVAASPGPQEQPVVAIGVAASPGPQEQPVVVANSWDDLARFSLSKAFSGDAVDREEGDRKLEEFRRLGKNEMLKSLGSVSRTLHHIYTMLTQMLNGSEWIGTPQALSAPLAQKLTRAQLIANHAMAQHSLESIHLKVIFNKIEEKCIDLISRAQSSLTTDASTVGQAMGAPDEMTSQWMLFPQEYQDQGQDMATVVGAQNLAMTSIQTLLTALDIQPGEGERRRLELQLTRAKYRIRSALGQETRARGIFDLMVRIQCSIPTALIPAATRQVTTAGASASTPVAAAALVAPRATRSSPGTSASAQGATLSTGNRSKQPRLR